MVMGAVTFLALCVLGGLFHRVGDRFYYLFVFMICVTPKNLIWYKNINVAIINIM